MTHYLRTIFALILFAVISPAIYAADYYVDSKNGSDSTGDGSQARPWSTIQKAASTMRSGDRCLIRGGVYRETVMAGDGQTFMAYNNEFVLVTGTDVVTGWSVKSGSIYSASVTKKVYEVFVNGARMNIARHPNEDGNMYNWDDWLSSTCNYSGGSNGGTADVSFSGLNSGSNHWVGGYYLGLHGHNFYQPNIGRIIGSSGNRISITDLSSQLRRDNPEFEGGGRGYIINHINALDTQKEWYWGDNRLNLWLPSGATPEKDTVEAQVRLWGFNLTNKTGVTISGINFKAASVLMEGSQRSTVENCTFRYHSPYGTQYLGGHPGNPLDGYYGNTVDGTSGLFVSGSQNTIRNNYMAHTWGQAIVLKGNSCLIENNLIENTSWMLAGLGSSILLTGGDNTVKGNTIRTTSGMGICAVQIGNQLIKRPKILNNDISDTSKMLMDSGQAAVYVSNGDASSSQRTLEGGVLAYNKIGKVNIFQNNNKGMGLYLDDGTDNAVIHHNVINAGGGINWAIFLHYNGHVGDNINVYNNTIWGYKSWAVWFAGNWDGKKGSISNCTVRNNIAQNARYNGNTVSHNRENVPASEFMDVSSGDFRLKPGSPSINAGLTIPGVTDNATDGRPDLGAYEHGQDWKAGSTVTVPKFPDETGSLPVDPKPTPTPTPVATPTPTPTPVPTPTPNTQTRTVAVGLKQGWNLMSIPVQPADTTLETVFKDIIGSVGALFAYDAKSSTYESYVPYAEVFDLKKVEAGRGYWIYMHEDRSFNVTGVTPSNSVPLAEGWNLVGYNFLTRQRIGSAIRSIKEDILVVYTFDGTLGDYLGYTPTGELIDLQFMNPGTGYWIYVTETSEWKIQ